MPPVDASAIGLPTFDPPAARPGAFAAREAAMRGFAVVLLRSIEDEGDVRMNVALFLGSENGGWLLSSPPRELEAVLTSMRRGTLLAFLSALLLAADYLNHAEDTNKGVHALVESAEEALRYRMTHLLGVLIVLLRTEMDEATARLARETYDASLAFFAAERARPH